MRLAGRFVLMAAVIVVVVCVMWWQWREGSSDVIGEDHGAFDSNSRQGWYNNNGSVISIVVVT